MMKTDQKILNSSKHFNAIVKSTIKQNFGIKNLFVQTWKVFIEEGFEGVWQRVSQFIETIRGLKNTKDGFYRNDYREWIRRYDTITNIDLEKMKIRATGFPVRPLISVIMPVYNPEPQWLEKAIASVCGQVYPHWELCIADDASTDPEVRKVLVKYQEKDSRIKIVFLELNRHISACSNSALSMATGDWIALLDHDDILPAHSLFWVVNAINKHPDVRLLYSDEDKIDKDGDRSQPYFKCDWNRELFYSQNMISHLGVYHADLVKMVGGFREGLEGSQDYDLALRCIELIDNAQIKHIPRVLYHWRVHRKSTALSSGIKPYAMLAGERALNEHFHQYNIQAAAKQIGYGYRVVYTLPDNPPLVSVIIHTRNGLHLLRKCIQSIRKLTTYPNYEILVVDNGSDDAETLAYFNKANVAEQGFRIIRIEESVNVSALNNKAVKEAKGEFLAFVNNDIKVISSDWLHEMIGLAMQEGIGAVGAKLFYPDDTIQHAGIVIGLGLDGIAGCAHSGLRRANRGYFGRAGLTNSFSAVTAACMVVRKALFEKMGGFDEMNLPIAYNDVDFCLRLTEAGYRNVFTPFAQLYHEESASRGKPLTSREQQQATAEIEYFRRRWSHLLLNDPGYSPNLTLEFSDFSLAWPPRVESLTGQS
jgi:glycosyltransferase involved in cell wall biosynthesis